MAEELPGDWTLDRLARMANATVHRQPGLILDVEEAIDLTVIALVEKLFLEPESTADDMFNAARYALVAANAREFSFAGLDRNVARSGREGTPPGFARYWHGRPALVAPWEDELVERLAVRQLWAALPPHHRRTFQALIDHGTYEGARTSLGITSAAWLLRIQRARRAARILWSYPDPPARAWGLDRPGLGPTTQSISRGLRRVRRKRQESRSHQAA